MRWRATSGTKTGKSKDAEHAGGLIDKPTTGRKKPRRTNILRYEDAEEPMEISAGKAVPKDLAQSGRTFSITDNWRGAKEPTKDIGFWWTGKSEFL